MLESIVDKQNYLSIFCRYREKLKRSINNKTTDISQEH